MEQLKVYTIGEDNLPLDGTEIILISEKSSFGVFGEVGSVEGVVDYIYDDLTEDEITLDEALLLFPVDIDGEGFNDEGEPTKIIIELKNKNNLLTRGMKWMYVHEAYPILSNSIKMPIQTKRYWDVAIEIGWIDVLSVDKETLGVYIHYHYKVKFSGKLFNVTWRFSNIFGDWGFVEFEGLSDE